MRSRASTTALYSSSGNTMLRSKRRGRFWYAMRNASRKPRVVTSSVGSPLRSSSALVATVVPILTHSTRSGVTGSIAFKPSRWRMPATAASLYCSGFSLSSLCVTSVNVPSALGRLPTTSVNVPPRSIQNCQREFFVVIVMQPSAQPGRKCLIEGAAGAPVHQYRGSVRRPHSMH